jgi:tetratricopeptide (TPR) repeat protein
LIDGRYNPGVDFMAESKRHSSPEQDEAALRAQQIASLLDEGLDRYFAARYEEAIHLWTRVLFFDRTHEKARAYIDRARKTVAEMQRHSEELLQTSRDLLEQGDTEAARRLLNEAVATGGDDLQVAALRVRLERLERVHALRERPADSPEISGAPDRMAWARVPWAAIAAGLALAAVAALAAMALQSSGEAPPVGGTNASAVPAIDRVPALSSSEVALVRARTAVAGGRLSEALKELDRVSLDSPDRPAADQLRVEVQQLLMASVRSSSVTSPREPVRR